MIVFQSRRRYVYQGVPEETYRAMTAAFAKGEFFNRPRFAGVFGSCGSMRSMTVDNALELYWLDGGREETLTGAARRRQLMD